MDRNQGGGMFGSYAGMTNVPVTSSPGSMSPYLNFDPAFISPNAESQFIFPEGANQKRGRFELAFSQIGGSILAGGAVGGFNGVYAGLRETRAAQLTGAVKRTQMLNFVAKQGASSAQTLGVVALMYSGFGVLMSKGRGAEDELNTLVAATATGCLYKCSAGTRHCVRGGAIGFGIALAYCLWSSKDRLRQMVGLSPA